MIDYKTLPPMLCFVRFALNSNGIRLRKNVQRFYNEHVTCVYITCSLYLWWYM